MIKQSLFTTEEKIIADAEEVLEKETYKKHPLRNAFTNLLTNYKKTFKQLRRLIKISDKQQLRLNEFNEFLENENYQLVGQLGQAFESFVRALSTAVDAKHPLTAGHSHRVTEYSIHLGKHLGLSETDLEALKYTALLHDIGKIGVPDAVLTKKGRFSDGERRVMNEHPVWTFKIIDDITLPAKLKDVPTVAASHHEKLDGKGYPYGLKGDKIPLFSRILAVSDVFDALTSLRDYPKYDGSKTLSFDPMPLDKAFGILEKDAGTHFDPDVVSVVLKEESALTVLWQKLSVDTTKKYANR
jgi:HD-GYP domain-containing protein (c-di-GMP phosphodiesterase class II)